MELSKKLHLGCGDVYLPGYLNVDYPPQEHTVQSNTKVDLYADITKLDYETNVISEIRLHHVFEHFDRPTAIKSLITWYGWLVENGKLTIETPDFQRSILNFIIGGRKMRAKTLRHLFGSHEAAWAVHYDGWYKAKYKLYLEKLGYRDLRFEFNHSNGLFNITVHAQKKHPINSLEDQKIAAKELLQLSTTDSSPTEQRLLNVWLDNMDFG